MLSTSARCAGLTFTAIRQHTTAIATAPAAASPSEPAGAVRWPPDGCAATRKTTSPPTAATAAVHSACRSRRPSARAASSSAKSSPIGNTGSTTTRRPKPSAAAWSAYPPMTAIRPMSHRRFRSEPGQDSRIERRRGRQLRGRALLCY